MEKEHHEHCTKHLYLCSIHANYTCCKRHGGKKNIECKCKVIKELITASKPTSCLLDPVPTKLLKDLLPVAEEPLLNLINSLSLGHFPKPFKLAVIKHLIKKPQLEPTSELANYRPISNLPFM